MVRAPTECGEEMDKSINACATVLPTPAKYYIVFQEEREMG
jgi:hypothetical protein